MKARGRRPRVVTVRDNFQSRSPSAKCCELYASLHDRFRLEVRILFYPMRTLKLAAWVTLIITGIRWREAGGSGAPPPDCHETNLKCFINKFWSRILVCSSIFRNSRYQCSGSILLLPATLNKWTREKKVSAFSLFH